MKTLYLNELPPSSNHSHFLVNRGGRILRIPSTKTKSWREYAGWEAVRQGVKMLDGLVELDIRASYGIYKNGNPKAGDVTNLIKELQDALQGIAYENDKQVIKVSIERLFKEEIFISVDIKPYVSN